MAIKSQWAEIETLVELARLASDKADVVRRSAGAKGVAKRFDAAYLADKIEAVARAAENSIGAFEAALEAEGLPRDHGDYLALLRHPPT